MNAIMDQIKNFVKYKDLVFQLVSRDLKLKYRRSFLGYLWSILNPLLIMIVLTIVFSTMFARNIENYPVYFIAGRTVFEFVIGTSNVALSSVTTNAALLKKTYVPKYIFTFSKVTSGLVDMVFSLGALLIVIIATGARFTPYFLCIPLVLLQAYIFTLGISFFLAQANVFFRDIQYIYHAVTTAWLYLTPLFYPIESLPERLQYFIKTLNPMYYYVAEFRDMVYYGQFPGPRIFWGGWLIAFLALGIGLFFFRKNEDKFILYI